VWYNLAELKGILRILVVAALTILLLVLFFRRSDPQEIGRVLARINPLWLMVGLLANFCALVCRTERWRNVLNPDDRPPFYQTFFSTAVGFMTSALLPMRAGDVVRPALLSRRTDIRFSTALGTVMIERLLDVSALLTTFLLFSLTGARRFYENPATAGKAIMIRSAGTAAAVLLALIIAFTLSVYFFSERIRRVHQRIAGILPRKIRSGWMAFFDSFVASLRIANNRPALIRILLLTLAIWTCLTSQFAFVLLSLGRPLPYSSSFFVTGVSILGMMIPTPGGVGGFHKACQVVLTSFYGFTVSASVAVALIFHLVGTAPVILTGLTLFLREHLSWNQLAEIGESRQE
jgi:uncharacterized protein (TIRG00374 family)